MSNTIPNIVIPPDTVVDLYADANVIAAGISVGDQIMVEMIADGEAKLYSGATLSSEPDDSTGFSMLYPREIKTNYEGDEGAFLWSLHGCTVNVGLY